VQIIFQQGRFQLTKRTRQRSARASNTRSNFSTPIKDNVVHLDQYQKTSQEAPKKRRVTITPKNINQEKLLTSLENPDIDIVFALGAAGTGKSMIATHIGIQQLQQGSVDKIIITRPAVSVDEQHGFLPGSLIEKMAPWVQPILDYVQEYYSKKEVESMIENGIIEVSPLSFMRGRTFKNAWIILDEAQNITKSQMQMALTRIGEGSKIIVTGDLDQHDRGYENNGLLDFITRLEANPNNKISIIRFTKKDVERHPIIEDVLKLYSM